MSNGKNQNIDQQIIELLYTKGPMDCSALTEHIPYKYKSISTKCLELEKSGLIERDKDRVWALRPGVTPRTLETGELEETTEVEEVAGAETPSKRPAPITRGKGVPLDQRGMFIEHMVSIGCTPKEAIPTIADIFFSGDIEDLKWLNHVLTREAAGYVTAQQRRLMMSWWANTRKLPYNEEDFAWPEGTEPSYTKPGKGEKAKPGAPQKPLDTGQGWRVGKDKAGDWVALPGGPMSYEDAVAAAERRALIASYSLGTGEEEGVATTEEGEGQPARRGARPRESMFEKMFLQMFESVIEGRQGRGDGESETVKRLQERIDDMERDRLDERFERIEGLVAQAVSRDPWDDYDRIQKMKERLGVGGPVVTDQSPAVQLIKDSTDKVDRNVARLMGIVERAALRGEEFKPEETRSAEERESKAGELLNVAQGRERSRGLRRRTFGL